MHPQDDLDDLVRELNATLPGRREDTAATDAAPTPEGEDRDARVAWEPGGTVAGVD